VRAAAASGDAGAVTLEAARALVALGHPLAAASAARRAAQLTAPGEEERDEALALAALALDSLGRHGDALALRQHLPPVLAGAPPAPPPPLSAEPGSPAWAEAIAARLARALIAPPAQAAPLLDRIAADLDRGGEVELAAAVRRERRAVAPLAPPAPLLSPR